jgi:hypothetical protein
MKKIPHLGRTFVILGLVLAAIAVVSPQATASELGKITMTVTAVSKKDAPLPAVAKNDVQLYQGKERLQAADWKHGEALYLAVLIDDSLDSSVASQWSDLKAFFLAQPKTTYVAVAYARNGVAMMAQDFTNDKELAAKALRIPMGGLGAFSSPYLAVQDLIKRWPATEYPRSILLISSGIDYFRGNFSPFSPDLDTTIEHAQKENINVWTIYSPGAGHVSRRFFRVSNAQMNLSRLSEETGAESYYLGVSAPVSFSPYLEEIRTHLSNQYLLTFEGKGGAKGRFERVRVATELPEVEFLTPAAVFFPASK